MKKIKLDNYTRVLWFIQGLPIAIQRRLLKQEGAAMEDLEKVDFKDLMKKTIELSKMYRQIRRIEHSSYMEEELNQAVTLFEERTDDDNLFGPPVIPPVQPIVQAIVATKPGKIAIQPQKVKENQMDFLAKKFEAMVLNL